MTMTDPIADMLTRLRNAYSAKHKTVSMPASRFKEHIARILKREGYIADYTVEAAHAGKTLTLVLKYDKNGAPALKGIKRISKPGLRRYSKSDSLPNPLGGLGIAIVSTSAGLLTQKECQQQGVGGEIVAYVW